MSNNLQQASLFHFTKIPLGKNFQSSVSQRPYKGLILVTSPPPHFSLPHPTSLNPLLYPPRMSEGVCQIMTAF